MTYQIDLRTRDELQITIQSGGRVRYFIAERIDLNWRIEELLGDWVCTRAKVHLRAMFRYFRIAKKELDNL